MDDIRWMDGSTFSCREWCDHRPYKTTDMCPDFIEPPARD